MHLMLEQKSKTLILDYQHLNENIKHLGLGFLCLLQTFINFLFSCSSDYIFLSGGDEKKKYCGQKVPPVYTSTDTLFIRFVSSSHLTAMKPGFVATYTSGNPSNKEGKEVPKFC